MRRIAVIIALLLPAVALAQEATPRAGFRGIFRSQRPQATPVPTPMQETILPPAPATPAREGAEPVTTKASTRRTPTPSRTTSRSEKTTRKSPETAEKTKTRETPQKAPKETEEEQEERLERERTARDLKRADAATTKIKDLLDAAHKGEYQKARLLLAPNVQKYFDGEMSALRGSLKGILDDITRDGSMEEVFYPNTVVRGEGARVEADIKYISGATERRVFDLVEIENEWRVLLPLESQRSAPAPAARPISTNVPAPQPAPAPAATPVPSTPTPTPAATPAATPVASGATPASMLSTPAPVGSGASSAAKPGSGGGALDLRPVGGSAAPEKANTAASVDAKPALDGAPWKK